MEEERRMREEKCSVFSPKEHMLTSIPIYKHPAGGGGGLEDLYPNN